jgi:thymidylate kinase
MKHLVIEGPDRTGKDTLIKNLLPFCQNAIISHFSTPIGTTDQEKKEFQQKSFDQEFRKAHFLLNSDLFQTPKKDKMNMIFWNRAHLGEFVYGNLYRQTHPEEWVMSIEKKYEYDSNPNVYLLLLVGDPEFLSSHDDGESFNSSAEARKKEIALFRDALNRSVIKKKMELDVSVFKTIYKPQELILQEVLQFLNT